MRAILLALLMLCGPLGGPLGAWAQDFPFAVRIGNLWGATEEELVRTLKERLEPLPMRWDFGPYYADYRLNGIGIAGEPFAAYLQMDRKTRRLTQILLERRQAQVTPESVNRIIDGMLASLGEPDSRTLDGDPGRPESAEFVWRRGDTTITLRLFDFMTTSIFGETPSWESPPNTPHYQRRRNNERFLPRRLVIRFNPARESAPRQPG